MQDLFSNIDYFLFIIIAIAIIIMAILVLEAKDMSHAIIYLALTFVGISAIYLLLSSEFLFTIQMTVYAGGVIILFLFALMLTRTDEFVIRGSTGGRGIRLGVMIIFFLFIIFSLARGLLDFQGNPILESNIGKLGFDLFNFYIGSFVILAFILIVVLIGAIYLVKNEGEPAKILDKTDFFPGGTEHNQQNQKSSQED
ncbi:MAG: NADH-quinone oxidoreductase subunit J family protein [Candidatus Kariarchaeaceae archaeon]|jgi:NADH-quinone oxidoreductase subunit J